MIMSFTCLLLAACCITTGVQGRLIWPFNDPFQEIFHPSGGGGSGGSSSPPESSPDTATSLQKAPAEAPTDDTSAASKSASKTSETEIRKLIEEELKKYQASSGKSDNLKKYSLDSSSDTAKTTTENPADLLRRIVAEELAKALPQTPPTTSSSSPSSPPEPLWKQWANTKNWAKQPGPDGQAAPGFIGTLKSRYGTGGYGSGGYPGPASGAAPPSGSPGWVWSQIAYKWASKDPTVIPPSQIVDGGDWETVLPPKKTAPAKS
uniref:15-hydroxyprostaglandin dehydrogenase n=1 Tax=Triatoma infestans TaxID=30076 RepID=A0A161ML50_TRIIF